MELPQTQNPPRGQIDTVPSRSGVGLETNHSSKVTDDEYTDSRRAKYGEDPAFVIHMDTSPVIEMVNDIRDKRNVTMRDNLILNPLSGYGRSMSQ
jgi:hypothetical protein